MPSSIDDINKTMKRAFYRLALVIALFLLILGAVLILFVLPLLTEYPTGYRIVSDLATAAIVSATVGALYDFLMRKESQDLTEASLKKTLEGYGLDEALIGYIGDIRKLDVIRRSGLVTVHKRLPSDILEEQFYSEPTQVRMLETWTGLQSLGIKRWIRVAMAAGAEVKLLMLHPNSIQVEYRSTALNRKLDLVRGSIMNDLTDLAELRDEKAEYRDMFQIRLYDASPVLQLYSFAKDTKITSIFGMYFRGTETIDGPQFEVTDTRNGSSNIPWFELLHKQLFDSLWDDEKTKDASEELKQLS
jgi:hypothetical protein